MNILTEMRRLDQAFNVGVIRRIAKMPRIAPRSFSEEEKEKFNEGYDSITEA